MSIGPHGRPSRSTLVYYARIMASLSANRISTFLIACGESVNYADHSGDISVSSSVRIHVVVNVSSSVLRKLSVIKGLIS